MGFHNSITRVASNHHNPSYYSHSFDVSCDVTIYAFGQNLTSSYTDQRNEASMVATSVLMFLLAALFFNLNLFSRLSDISAILNPSIRLFLSTALSLFLPVMSYLFSEAKNEDAASGQSAELSLRARTILMWMLLVELLRKKVEAILVTAGMGGYSGTIERAARITWLGILVFFNVKGAGRKATYGILWVLAAAKLVQRVVITELGKRSFAYGKNAQLLTSYMAQMLRQEGNAAGSSNVDSELLRMCNYAVMGEENLEKEAGPQGYHLELKKVIADNSTIVTVGKIWRLAENDQLIQGDADTKRLCLSFALYKLLRRRFEDLPITDAETCNCRRLIFRGLCNEGGKNTEATEVALFQVLYNELQFLCEYYHSVHPVVLSSPFFFLANYILFPITVWTFCILTIVLCSNGDVAYALRSIQPDNNVISVGLVRVAGCFLSKIAVSPPAFFATIDVSITILLFLTFLYEQVWEFLVFILSNWLMVSLICDYTAEPRWRESPVLRGLIRCILWVRSKMSHPNLCFKQFSVLGFRRLFSLTLPTKAVPKEVKKSIMEYLLEHVDNDGLGGASASSLSNGWCALAKHPQYHPQLSWACESNSVAEVILTWHIATSLLEVRCPPNLGSDHRKVATTLSKYCTYLVAFRPELLPDDKDGTKRVYKAMQKDLKGAIGCWSYYLSPERTQYDKVLLMITDTQLMPPDHAMRRMTVVQKGALLGKTLIDEAAAEGNQEPVWKLLADLWTEVMVYVAPSSGEAHVKAHKEVLVRGGEFLTVLWALATHTGITRPAVAPWEAAAGRAACV